MTNIDLHIHTINSDGTLTPKEVIDVARNNNLKTIAIADHDTVKSYDNDLIDYAKANNIQLIKAVEISTKIAKCGIHVLGYNIDTNNEVLINKLSLIRNARHDYLHNVSKKLEEIGYRVSIEDLDKVDAVTKAHIALDVINNKDNEELLFKTFNHIPGKGEFIETIMNENCPAYVRKETVTPKEAAELIRIAGGKVILAHPVAYEYEDGLKEADILKIVNDMKADGIESYYIYVDRNNEKHNHIHKWNKFAEDNNLITTIGSDFHVDDKLHPTIGFNNEDLELNDEKYNEIVNNLLK